MTNCIEIKGLAKEYKTFTLGPIDLTVPGGSILGLIGENGAGKSTLLKCLLGILTPTSGTVELLGTSTAEALGEVGYVPDEALYRQSEGKAGEGFLRRAVFRLGGWAF